MDGVNSPLPPTYTPPVNNTQPVNSGTPVNNSPPTQNYTPDAYSPTSTYGSASAPTSYPMSQLMYEQPTLAGNFSRFFIDSSDKFLKMGSNWLGKSVLNLMAGNIPFLTSKATSTQISNNINSWLGRADIIRAGVNPYQAILLQDVGVRNMTDLANIRNPQDQMTLSQMINGASATRGQPIFVSPANVTAWVTNAQQLPKNF